MSFDHPGYRGYFPHMKKAGGWSIKLLWAGIAVAVHSVLPCFFQSTASKTIKELFWRL